MSPPRSLHLEPINTIDGFMAIKKVWTDLLIDYNQPSPFLTWEWMFNWWQTYSSAECELLILLVKDVDNNIIAIAPFYCRSKKGIPYYRTIYFIGTGEPEYMEVSSEYLDILAPKSCQKKVCAEITKYFKEIYRDWTTIKLLKVLSNSLVNEKFITTIENQGISHTKKRCGIRYSVQLPSTWDQYYESLKPSFRRAIKVAYKRLEALDFSVATEPMEKKTIHILMRDLMVLHTRRWSMKGQDGAFISDEFMSFHNKIIESFSELKLLNLVAISVNNTTIAVLYNYCLKDTTYYYQSGFDIYNNKLLSPGLLAHCEAIKNAISNKHRVYDFMMGGTKSYKQKYNCVNEDMFDLVIYKNSIHANFVKMFTSLKQLIKYKKNV